MSVGIAIFDKFYDELFDWFNGTFVAMSEAIMPVFEVGLIIMIIWIGLSFYFNKGTAASMKLIKVCLVTVIAITFLELGTVTNMVLTPMLDTLVGFMQILLQSEDNSTLGSSIFSGVDTQFNDFYEAVDNYRNQLGDGFSALSFIPEYIVIALLSLLFGALYGIFTVLIIVGFFGFMLLMAFAPIFIVLGVFNKTIFTTWVKNVMNYFLIPIFTAAVMSITQFFLDDAAGAIELLDVDESIFLSFDLAMAFLIGIFSVGMHWKAPEFAAGLTGGVASGAGSIVGTAAAVAATGYGLTKASLQFSRGATTGGGTGTSGAARGGATMREGASRLYDKYRAGGVK